MRILSLIALVLMGMSSSYADETLVVCTTYETPSKIEVEVKSISRNRIAGIVSKENRNGTMRVVADLPGANYGLCGSNDCFVHSRVNFRLVLNDGWRSGVFSFNSPATGQLMYEPVTCDFR